METGGIVLVEKESDIAVDIGVGRGGSCGGGERAASLAEDRVAIPPFDFHTAFRQRSSNFNCVCTNKDHLTPTIPFTRQRLFRLK